MIDYHVHTRRCGHASGQDREYVETAISRGLTELGFSDHVPCYYEAPQGVKVSNRGMPRDGLEEYVVSVCKLKAQYPEITIKLGLEIDYVPGQEKRFEALLAQYPWDYLMGTVHFIPDWNFGYIGYDKEHSLEAIYQAYYHQVALAAETKLFDFLGHIDLPRRFFPQLPEEDMTDLEQSLAIRLGKAGAVVELSTYAIRNAKQEEVGILPSARLLRYCRQQGVRVTAGSDAHAPSDVAADFDQVRALLRDVGYDTITTFTRRKAAQVKWRE
ncbi:MAG: histidinol-phosphatase HisJ family protein [Firmicutes bacterium]|nr:histidinol-phosphatase HisJ family protein [Bacillota bacterium]